MLPKGPIDTKAKFVKHYREGRFGNASLTWDSYRDYIKSKYNGLVHFRNRMKGGDTFYNKGPLSARRLARLLMDMGTIDNYYISAMAPHRLNLIQGEVQETPRGLGLFYSQAYGLPMRDALTEDGRQVYGLEAVGLLKANLCARSYDWLQVLLDEYEGHVVEFSTFSRQWGTLPGFNTVFWEVRLY